MAYSADSFVADEQPTTAKWNKLWTNDASFNDGSGIADDKILTRHILEDNITAPLIDWASTGADAGIWWEELGRDAVSSGTTMEITSFTARKYLQIKIVDTGSAANGTDLIFNNDTGSNYATARTLEGGAFSSAVSQASIEVMGNYKGMQMSLLDVVNYSSQEKIVSATWISGPRSGTVNSAAQIPTHGEYASKWVNTSAQITRVKVTRRGGAYAAGSEIVVLGHD